MFVDTQYDTQTGQQTTNIDASVSSYLDLSSYEGIRLKEKDLNTVMIDANSNRIDFNKATYLANGIDIVDD